MDVLYLDSEDPEDVNHEAIIDNILNARRTLKNGLAVSFLEHSEDLGRVLNEAATDLPVMSMLLDEDAYGELEINTFVNLGFSNRLAAFEAAERFNEFGVQARHPVSHLLFNFPYAVAAVSVE